MSDKESWSIWDHITGSCFQGKYEGTTLDVWPIFITTAEAARHDYPDLIVSLSGFKGFKSQLLQRVYRKDIDSKGFMPPSFGHTMADEIDPRLDKFTQGLGVIVGQTGKYYPMQAIAKGSSIEDVWQNRPIKIERGAIDGVPRATWLDDGEMPMQLLTRWYGFSFTYPGCEIYSAPTAD